MAEIETRSIDLSIEIAQDPDRIWRAITDPAEIANWFAPEARVEPGVDGSLWVSWGGGMEYSQKIEIWEPGKHLRLVDVRPAPTGPMKLCLDFYIIAGNGTCQLRIVNSGFGTDSNWDNEFDAVSEGWRVFLPMLRNSITGGGGKPCRSVFRTIMLPIPSAETWAKLTGGTLDNAEAGVPYKLTWQELPGSGVTQYLRPPHMLIGTVSGTEHMLNLLIEGTKKTSFSLVLQTFGLSDEAFQAEQDRWVEGLERWTSPLQTT